ncbi:uridine phosphorylase, partial [Pectobacterium carotovorum subsp. carotovorum]
GRIAGVSVNRTQQEVPDAATMKLAETTVIKVLLEESRRLLADE